MEFVSASIMEVIDIKDIIKVIIICSIPGASGGILAFIWAKYSNHYENNKYIAKFSLEFFGAVLVSSFVGPMIINQFQGSISSTLFLSFLIGLFWAKIIQIIRGFLTRHVEGILNSGGVN